MNHIADTRKMVSADLVKCPHCEKECLEGTPEAEFIGWHGICSECYLNSEDS